MTIDEDDSITKGGEDGEKFIPAVRCANMLTIIAGVVSDHGLLAHNLVQEISDDDDFENEGGLPDWLDHNEEGEMSISAIYSDSDIPTPPSSSVVLPRNPPIEKPFLNLDDFTHNGVRLHPRTFVELRDRTFMKIVHIVKDERSSDITIRGSIFRRTRTTDGVFDKKRNEVCWMIYIDDDDPRDHSVQGLETRKVTEVVKRRHIRLTNQPFPALSYRDDRINERNETIEDKRVLVCRYKYVIFYPHAKARALSRPWSEKIVLRLREGDCDKRTDNNAKDADIRTSWRGETILGGTQEGWLPGEKEHLRQESVSNRGINAHQPLRGPPGLDFPAGDPMTRGSVGTLLGIHDLNPVKATSSTRPNETMPKRNRTTPSLTSSSSPTSNIAVHSMATTRRSTTGSKSTDATTVVSNNSGTDMYMDSPLRLPRVHNERKRPAALSFDEDYDVSDQESCKDSAMILDLTRSMRESSIQPRRLISGINTERTEGIRTSRFTSPSGTSRERYTEVQSHNSPSRCRKRRGVEVQVNSVDGWKTKRDFIDLSRPRACISSSLRMGNPCPRTGNPSPRTGNLSPRTGNPSPRTGNPLDTLQVPRPTTDLSTVALPRRILPVRPFPHRRYTFGDCFCGAGGMSRGAINAGLRVAWGFDFNLPACRTYQLNFLGTPIYHVWANDFSNSKKDCKVDICHISPPCQFFSPLHTSDGKDDDMNTASLFAIEALLKKAKPRIVTLEETAGLVKIGSHKDFFSAVINMFTTQGFSVRLKVLSCADFGVSQQRKRLIIIASW